MIGIKKMGVRPRFEVEIKESTIKEKIIKFLLGTVVGTIFILIIKFIILKGFNFFIAVLMICATFLMFYLIGDILFEWIKDMGKKSRKENGDGR